MKKTGSDSAASQERSYIAFISYRHKSLDKQAAEMIQRSIERYTVPREFRERSGGRRLGMVFRDEDELPASSSLSGSITYALDHSRYLLVICTPDLPLSKWCEQEIYYFLQTHDRDHVLAVLADGTPEVSFSPWLLHSFDEAGNITGDTEPLAANIAGKDHSIDRRLYRKEIVRIYAALLGCPFDALWQRERRARTQRLAALLGVVMAIMASFTGLTLAKNREIRLQNEQITEQNRQITEQNRQITSQNEQIADQNEQIKEQNLSLEEHLSSTLVGSGRSKLESYDLRGALEDGLGALLERREGAPYDHRAEKLLNDALGAYRQEVCRSTILYEHTTGIRKFILAEEESTCVLMDENQRLCCLDLPQGTVRWDQPMPGRNASVWEPGQELLEVGPEGTLLCRTTMGVYALDLSDGSILWEHESDYYSRNPFFGLSADREQLAILEYGTGEESEDVQLLLLSARTGEELNRVSLGSDVRAPKLSSYDEPYNAAVRFSEDGALLAVCVFEERRKDAPEEERSQYRFYVVDTASGSILHRLGYYDETVEDAVIYGLNVEEETGDLFVVMYASRLGGIVAISLRWEDENYAVEFTDKAIGGAMGINSSLLGETMRAVPMLRGKYQTLVASDRSLLIYDPETLTLRRTFEFSAPILDMFWLDREEEILHLLTVDGNELVYDLAHEGSSVVETAEMGRLNQSGLRTGKVLGRGPNFDPENGASLTVREEKPTQLLLTKCISDPAFRPLTGLPESLPSGISFQSFPERGRICLVLDSGPGRVIVYDALTHEELSQWEWENPYLFCTGVLLDEDHLVFGRRILGADGSQTELEGVDEDAIGFYDTAFQSVPLSGGGVLTAYLDDGWSAPENILCWIDGKSVPVSADPETCISQKDSRLTALGSSGLFLSWGAHGPEGENAYAVLNCRTGERFTLEDRGGGTERHLAAGEERPVFAAADDAGGLYLYSPEEGTCLPLEGGYGPEEIWHMCFAPGDGSLWVLTTAGRLDGYAVTSGERVFSEYLEEKPDYLDGMRCRAEEGGSRIWLLFSDAMSKGGMLCIDCESWVVVQEAGMVYDCFPESGSLYALHGGTLGFYPLRDLDSLESWAREWLEDHG